MADDYSADTQTTGQVTVGGLTTGRLEEPGDRDWFAVTLTAGKTYRFDLEGLYTDKGTLADPKLYGIHDSDGNLLSGTTNDDGGSFLNSRVTFTATETGVYYVSAGGWGAMYGSYELSVTEVAGENDVAAGTGTTGTVAVEGSVEGEVDYGGDRDWFAVTLAAGKTYRFDLEGSRTSKGTLSDPKLYGIHDSNGNLLSGTTNDDGGTGWNSRVTFKATEGGIYYVSAGGHGNGTGTYTLSVTDITPADVNEAPAFGSSSYAFNLAENTDGSTTPVSVGTVSATDPDAGDTVTYSIESGNGAGLFAINADTGALTYVGSGEDYESATKSHALTVRASDGTQHADVTVTVSVTNVSDVAPTFGSSSYAFNLAENADGSTTPVSVGTVSATDPEVGDRVTYSIEGGNAAGLFAIDSNSGALTYTGEGENYGTNHSLTVRASDGTQHADVIVTVISDDFSAGTGTTGTVAVGGSVKGEVQHDGDRDWFKVTLEAGKKYRFDLEGSYNSKGTLSDPTLYGIHDSDGNLLSGTTDDDDGAGFNSRVMFTATKSGVYYISAGGFRDGVVGTYEVGTYTLSVAEVANVDDFAAGTGTTGTVTVGGSVEGEVEYDGDRDWFAVTLTAGKTYQFDLEGSDTNKGTLFDPTLYGIHDADGNLLPGTTNDDSTDTDRNSQVTFTATETGTYYVSAGGFQDTRVGTYTLSMADITPPAFGSSSYAFNLAENAAGSTTAVSLGTISASPEVGDTVAYSIVGGNDAGLFTINADTGALTYVGSGEDYESKTKSHALTVRASDGALVTDTTVTITVTDVNEAPAFGSSSYAFNLVENADGSETAVSLGTVSATDPDAGDTVAYSIVGGNGAGLFAIDADTGALTYVGSGEDYESTTKSHALTVRASDGTLDTDTIVTINVTDVTSAPVFESSSYAFNLAENTDGSTAPVSLGTVSATDPEAGGAVTYSLDGIDPQGFFTIDGSTGELTYIGPGEDYESGPTSYVLTVRAGDETLNVYTTVTITITDMSDVAPAFDSSSYAFNLAEYADGSEIPVSLGTVSATDPEAGDTVSYSIVGGNDAGLFDINGSTGALTYTGEGEDYESATKSYALTVRASDGTQHVDATVTITVTDEAEAPAFDSLSYAFNLAENVDGSATPVSLGTVSATDPDAGDTVAYSIVDGNGAGLFAIDADTGVLTYVGSGENYESATKSHALTVRASDGALVTDTTVTITVTDVNEAPAFGSSSYTFNLEGNADGSAVPVSLGTVSATDPDAGDTVSYSIVGGNTAGLFAIDADTGALTYIGSGEDSGAHALTVQASDGVRSAAVAVTVTADDFAAGPETTGAADLAAGDVNVTGEIKWAGDRDWFAVTLESGKTYQFDLKGSGTQGGRFGTLEDPYLYGVYDADGNLVPGTTDDDGGWGESGNARVQFTPTEGGMYYVATGGAGNEAGTYTLRARVFEDDFAAWGNTATGTLAVGGEATGTVDFKGDRDWFAVTLESGKTYRIDLEGSGNGNGLLSNPYLHGIYDADGNFVSGTTDDDGGTGRNSRLEFTATSDGIWHVSAGAAGNQLGDYLLSIEEVI